MNGSFRFQCTSHCDGGQRLNGYERADWSYCRCLQLQTLIPMHSMCDSVGAFEVTTDPGKGGSKSLLMTCVGSIGCILYLREGVDSCGWNSAGRKLRMFKSLSASGFISWPCARLKVSDSSPTPSHRPTSNQTCHRQRAGTERKQRACGKVGLSQECSYVCCWVVVPRKSSVLPPPLLRPYGVNCRHPRPKPSNIVS